MTNLERVVQLYEFILTLVLTHKKVIVKVDFNHSAITFEFKNGKYYAYTEKAVVESEYFSRVYDLVKHEIADNSFAEDIKIIICDKTFAIIKRI